MKKSFMTRVLAVSLSAAMTFSLSAANMATASAATKNVVLSPSTVTLQYGTSKAKKTLKLKNNSLKWKVKSASVAEKGSAAKGKKVLTVTNTSSKVVLKAKNIKKTHKVTVTVKLKRTKNKKNYSKTLKCKATVKPQKTGTDDPTPTPTPTPDVPAEFGATVNATSPTRVEVKFNQVVDNDTLVPENFSVAEEGVQVTQVDKGDGRNVVLTLSGTKANTKYTLSYKGLTVDGKAVEGKSVEFTTPVNTAEGYSLTLKSNTEQIKADGYAEALITCEVRDPQGELVKDKDYTVRFTSDRGSFSRPDSVTAEGVASNVLRSEALDVAQDVKITAEIIRVEGTDDAKLVGTQATKTLNMTPVLSNIVVNPIEGAESNQADRLTLHFQNKVDDDTYKKNGVIDTSRINIEVYDNISKLNSLDGGVDYSTDKGTVVNLVPVAGDDKALQVLVSGTLTDNRYVGVKVKMTDPNSGKTSTYEESFMLTDATTPRVLKVEPQNRRQVKVTFSEAVLPQNLAGNASAVAASAYAENLSNYIIGGRDLNDSQWGDNNKKPKIEVGSGLDNQDGREVVTITLGEDKYFAPDKYTLTVHNIGDWAAATDGVNNIVTTDSKDFTVPNDDTKPDVESVEVQSPEQILVTFNKPVKKDANYENSALAANKDDISLAVKRTDDDGTAANSDNETNKNSIIQLRETNGTNVGLKDGINPIRVTQVDTVGRQFLVETTKDWSVAYGQQGNYNDDYFNHKYQIYIPANALVNTDNGEKNTADIVRDLSDNAVLKNADTTPPVIDSNIGWNGSEATVKFSEPVKIRNINQTKGLNDEGTTASVKQKEVQGNNNNIQQATAEFICPGKQTVAGTFDKFVDSTDREVIVKPTEDLTAGNWTLRVSGISDDFGNTISGGGNVEVKGVETGFKVAWASVSTSPAFKPTSDWNAGNGGTWDATKDIYIFVKFTNAVNTRNSAVYDMRNYTINSTNGAEIRDAYVKAGIQGYDGSSSITDSVTIVIPARSAYVVGSSPSTTTLAVSNQVVSAGGLTLAGNAEYRLPYNSDVISNNSKTNAIFGDHADEQSAAFGSDAEYKTAVENAIKSDNYRKIILHRNITGGLNISRPVDIELNGNGIFGTVKASFNDGATCSIINGKSTQATVEKLDISTPNADWYIGGSKIDSTISGNSTNNDKVTVSELIVRAIPDKTLVNDGIITKLTVNSGSSSVKIVNNGTGTIDEIVLDSVNKSGTVKILSNSSNQINKITINSPVKVEARKATSNDVESLITGTIATIKEVIVNASRDVELKTADGEISKLSGNTPAVTVKNTANEVKTDLIDEVVNNNKDGIKKAIIDSLVDTASVTSGATVANIARDINKDIDPNGGAITGYKIYASIDGATPVELTLLNGKKFDGSISLEPSDSTKKEYKVVISIQKDGDSTSETVKTITVKKSS